MIDALHEHDSRANRNEDASVSMGLLPALLVGIVLFAIAMVAHATLYKWTDESGVVHYSDHLPPDAVNRARLELNREGVPIRKTDKEAAHSQATASGADREVSRQLARAREASERRDRALLDSYSSTAEIDLAKDRALSTINAQIASTSSYIADLTRRRNALVAEKAAHGTQPVPDSLTHALASIDAELAHQQAFITARRSEAATTTARYDADRLRYEELTRTSPSSAASMAARTELSVASQASSSRN